MKPRVIGSEITIIPRPRARGTECLWSDAEDEEEAVALLAVDEAEEAAEGLKVVSGVRVAVSPVTFWQLELTEELVPVTKLTAAHWYSSPSTASWMT